MKRYLAGHSASLEAVPCGTRSGTLRDIRRYLPGHGRDQIRGVPLGTTVTPTVRTRPARPFGDEGDGSDGSLPLLLLKGLDALVGGYCRRPSSAPQSGQVPALPAGSASPTTPNPAFTTKPSAAVREIPSCWAKSPNCSHRESSSLMWASWRDISNRGRGDISGEFTTSPQPLHVRLTAVCGTLQG